MCSDIITALCLFSIYIQPIKFLLWLSVNGRVEPWWLAEEQNLSNYSGILIISSWLCTCGQW